MTYPSHRRSGWLRLLMTAALASAGMVSAAHAAGPGAHGRVFGQDEKGKFAGLVPGAKIEFRGQAGNVVAQATADQNGYYKVDLPPGEYFYKVQAPGYKDEDAGRAIRLKQTEGYAVFHFSLTKGENDPNRKPPLLPVAKTGILHGRVLEKTDQGEVGIEGAVIILKREGSRRLTKVLTRGPDKEGHRSGFYEVSLEEGMYRASVLARGFERFVDPQPIQVTADEEAKRDFVLARFRPEPSAEQGIQGTVTLVEPDPSAATRPEIDVRLFSLPSRGGAGKPVTLDDDGGFKLKLPVGRYRLVAAAKGYETAHSPPTHVFREKYSFVKLVLRRERPQPPEKGIMVLVSVTDAANKKPIPDASVLLRKGEEPLANAARGTTDATGQLTLRAADAGEHTVLVRAEGYEPGGKKLRLDRGRVYGAEIALRATAGPVEPPMEQLVTVTGYVVYRDRTSPTGYRGIGKATLSWREAAPPSRGNGTTSEPSGRYSVKLGEGTYQVQVTPPRGFEPVTESVAVTSGMEPRYFILRRSTQPPPVEQRVNVSGYVVHKDEASRTGYRGIPGTTIVWRRVAPAADVLETVTSARVGSYSLTLPEGRYEVRVRPPAGFAPTEENVVVRQGMPAKYFVLARRAKPEPEPERLVNVTGQVLAMSPRMRQPVGVPGAEVLWIRTAGVAKAESGTGGGFAVRLPEDGYRVQVRAKGFEPLDTKVMVRNGMGPVRLVLNRGTGPKPEELTLSLSIFENLRPGIIAAVRPVPGADIVISRNRRPVATGRSDIRGSFSTRLKPGEYDIRVTHKGHQPVQDRVTLTTDDVSRRIALQRETGPTPPGKPTLTVRVVQRSIRPIRPIRPPIGPVRPGPIRPGTVPIPGAQVTVIQGRARVATGTTDRDGYYRVPLAPGNYSVKASAQGFGSGGAEVTIGSSDVTREIELTRTGGGGVKPPPPGKPTLTIRAVQPSAVPLRPVRPPIGRVPPSKVPIPGAQITVMQGNARVASGTTDPSGYYRVQLAPGNYSVKAFAHGFSSGGAVVTIGSSDVTREIELTKTATPVKPTPGAKVRPGPTRKDLPSRVKPVPILPRLQPPRTGPQ